MFNESQHIDNLLRHLQLVRGATQLLGRRLMWHGQSVFGRLLIARGLVHDNSKFFGIEWDYLHAGNDVPKDVLENAICQHQLTNQHHPEYWGGINKMPDIALAEMVCDFYARSQEFGTNLRYWINTTAAARYLPEPDCVAKINHYIDILLEDAFVREELKADEPSKSNDNRG